MAKRISCREMGINCEFLLRDEDEAELIEFVKRHAENVHGMRLSDEDVREVMRETDR